MSKTYKTTGINLKTQAIGESDRLVTILTREFGLIRAVAPGSRKHNSSLGGRSGMFVVNELLIAKGRSLDKITQAQTVKTYPGLATNLGKLAASQYLAEVVLCQALSEQPQEELYELLNEHLSRIEELPSHEPSAVIAYLAHGLFHLLAIAGLTPQVQACCLTGSILTPDFTNPDWQVGFSIPTGGTVCLTTWKRLKEEGERGRGGERGISSLIASSQSPPSVKENTSSYKTVVHRQELPVISSRLDATELSILQQLSQPEIMQDIAKNYGWFSVEQILRQYAQYHLGRPIRSAALIDSYFATHHDATV
ncbi:DNA repair protein RecO [Scytonema hofmannii PCC 7110]|uniref:DNA repair protein RecO n=1 Tax=Scytonema hofmannii PCC 7110 TaxID=128403 RepID=A0A139XDX9_9CYAN|nr:DNA repair protein RecO [Scytonema hofmannii]KYC42885.1 DNA repair protein RecO [Scytonema hofmannii PCC 7110]